MPRRAASTPAAPQSRGREDGCSGTVGIACLGVTIGIGEVETCFLLVLVEEGGGLDGKADGGQQARQYAV
ncbi:MAG TPA: hypothetical protein VMU54_06350 [Planctomycetota bacterium]|nr:hypothetical protein [Planctomycetota bacterium]